MRRFISITLLGLVGALAFAANTSEINSYYDKHIIIAVDQTSDVQKHDMMQQINSWLRMILTNQRIPSNELSPTSIVPDELCFNPKTDCIELFAFGIQGHSDASPSNTDNSYYIIKHNCGSLSKENYYKEVYNALLQSCGKFSPGDEFDRFYKNSVNPLLSQSSKKYEVISQISGLTLSYYVYPFILNKVETSIPARAYYLVLITNFKSGSLGGVNTEDEDIFNKWITDSNKRKFINKKNAELEGQYIKANVAKYIPNIESTDEKLPIIVISQLLPSASVISSSSSADIYSTIVLKQKQYKSEDFNLSQVAIKEDSANIGKVKMITCINHDVDNVREQWFDKDNITYKNKSFLFEDQKLSLAGVKPNDTIYFSYVFFPRESTSLLPTISIAEQYYVMNDSDFITPPTPFREYLPLLMIIFIAVLIVGVLYIIYKKRGQSRKWYIQDFRIWPISNSHYMQVKDKKVINYDCWYWKGVADAKRSILITGKFVPEKKVFAKSYSYVVEYSLADSDSNKDFSFRPSGKNGSGEALLLNTFYLLPMASDGSFSFNAEAYVDFDELEKQNRSEPNFKINNILDLTASIKVTITDGKKVIRCSTKTYPKYSFIVRPALEKPDLWVSFDLGTTGSCMAFGQAGNLAQRNNIHMVNNRTKKITAEQHLVPIFPSKIIIPDNSRLFNNNFNIEEADEPKDFVFGNRAEQHWNESRNRFQSIKKLLGYTTTQKIFKDGLSKSIQGQDLAFLIAKGIYTRFETDLNDYQSDQIKSIFLDDNGNLQIERAIVAVPNNYMLNKVQEMVDSVKRLNKFKEVHYLYESEGVFMTYLSRELTNLLLKQDSIFVVYDMGGATINITAFQIKCITRTHQGVTNISRIEVDTLAKVGYAVGGDDIDFALIQFLYSIPSIAYEFDYDDDKIFDHQKKNKNKLIEIVRKIKLDWIDNKNNTIKHGNVTQNIETFWGHLQSQLSSVGIELGDITESDIDVITKEIQKRTIVHQFVLNYVQDCTVELLSSLHIGTNRKIELIFSGRSILYPGVKEVVTSTILHSKYSISVWTGFNKADGTYDDEEIKTAVARGACWYAMNGGQIGLKHDSISFSFGYLDTINGKLKFIPMIDKMKRVQSHYNENGEFISYKFEPIDPNLNTVDFVQMLGTNYDEIYDGEVLIPHKINFLDRVDQATITGRVESLQISIDRENNFDYKVQVNGIMEPITKDTNPHSRFGKAKVQTEIADENSKAYTFAAVNIYDEKNK